MVGLSQPLSVPVLSGRSEEPNNPSGSASSAGSPWWKRSHWQTRASEFPRTVQSCFL